ncbi:2c-methyl-d-erythritol -cyclodiphosphate synthase domain-containing protein [Cyclospora cayetanensis]|uniref:2c-methyl-d-erythritol-cyclodiphosphate synthase domain-containing protein n=1 Tax=Cyclospora cayetanensis TaxID=88456 RepID=A0A1D3CVQ4_9EIME|nr:2c-methyl-d-erythritol -cyclodiphosphate synthase domain-containing protein [Cyclospora cayetanensis]
MSLLLPLALLVAVSLLHPQNRASCRALKASQGAATVSGSSAFPWAPHQRRLQLQCLQGLKLRHKQHANAFIHPHAPARPSQQVVLAGSASASSLSSSSTGTLSKSLAMPTMVGASAEADSAAATHPAPALPFRIGHGDLRCKLLEKQSCPRGDSCCLRLPVDATLLLQYPHISSKKQQMIDSLAEALGISSSRISLKAKTAEGVGPVGRSEAVECYAVALLQQQSV